MGELLTEEHVLEALVAAPEGTNARVVVAGAAEEAAEFGDAADEVADGEPFGFVFDEAADEVHFGGGAGVFGRCVRLVFESAA